MYAGPRRLFRLGSLRRLADTGVAADQNHAARHQATAEYAVKLTDAGGLTRHFS